MSPCYPHITKFNLTYTAKSDLMIAKYEGFPLIRVEGMS